MHISLPLAFIAYMFLQALILALAGAVYFFNRRSRANRYFAWFLLAISAWTISGALYMYFPVVQHQWVAVQMLCGIFMGPTYYFFSRSLTDSSYQPRRGEYLVLLPAVYITLLSLARIFIPEVSQGFSRQIQVIDNKLHRVPDLHYVVYTLGIFGEVITGLVFMGIRLKKDMEPGEKHRLITVFLATLILAGTLLVFNSLANLLGHSLDPNITMAALLVTLSWMSVSILRHKAWKIETLMDIIRDHENELAQRNHAIESELDLARLVQKKLLPEHPPVIPGFRFSSFYYPMDKVGGDFYDYHICEDRLGLIVADVSGHGIPGAFLATVAKMGFQEYAARAEDGPTLMAQLDALIAERAVKSMFVTAVYAGFSAGRQEMSLTNCGHCAPLVFGPSRHTVLEAGTASRPLGLSFGLSPHDETVRLLPGDRILLFTDGIIEMLDQKDQEYGTTRLQAYLQDHLADEPGLFMEGLMRELQEFSAGGERIDDISLTVVDVE